MVQQRRPGAADARGAVVAAASSAPAVAAPPHPRRIPLLALDDDRQFCCRASIRPGDLARSIAEHGQQQPVVVRGSRRADDRFQLVCGFRRVAALRQLGEREVLAEIRNDLGDVQAWRLAIGENARRQTLTDLDRAHLLWSLEQAQVHGLGADAGKAGGGANSFYIKRLRHSSA